jgi:glycosyltransferase involved in cell wall biosynthesis
VTDREHALLVPPADPAAMAQAISVVLADGAGSQRMARAARNLVAEKYSPRQRAHSLLQVYMGVFRARLR